MATRFQRAKLFNGYAFLIAATAFGCGGSDTPPASGVGGASSVGGATSTGGTSGTSIVTGTGGAQAAGGGVATGGAAAAGGAQTGGDAATGGKAATGGMNAAGGKAATGGMNATGGKAATGGMNSIGGVAPTGGTRNASGGMNATGGLNATGGSKAAGGSSATGGSSTVGGASGNRSPGCGTAINRPNPKTQQTMDVQGTTRYYLLDVPTAADNQSPLMLIFALHGYDMNNVSVTGLYNFTSRSGGKAITVYPQGEGPAPGDTSHWGDGVLKSTWTGNTANYTFIQNLMTDLESRYCIDPSRVFITGFSMGGMFTNSIACAHSDWFRGFAPVEGAGPGSCSNANAKPAIMIHQGTADTTVSPTTGGEPTRDFWIKQNGCAQTATSTFTGCQSYSTCAQPVVYCVGNWGHTITSTASANIWGFFSGLP